MGLPHSVTKTIAAAAANSIALSQSPGAAALLINGTASTFGSTLSGAAGAPAGAVVIPVTSVSGLVPGTFPFDNSNPGAIVPGTVLLGVDPANLKITISKPVGGTGVGSGDGLIFFGVSVLDTQRRVIIPSNGSNNSAINFTIVGTNDFGNQITDTIAGPGVTNAVISNLDFKTVTSITPSGAVTGAITVGTTNGSGLPGNPSPVASTPWFGVNWHAQPLNIELAGIVGAGVTINWSWQYTYDDPNNLPAGVAFPQPFNHPTLNSQTGSLDGSINDPVAAVRLTINSATLPASMRATWMEAGISGQ